MGFAVKMNAMDLPNKRKVHHHPIPRSGGISMALGAFVPVLLWVQINDFVQSLLLGCFILIIFGLIDDFRNIDYKIKFIAQVFATVIVVHYGGLKINDLGAFLPEGYKLPDYIAVPLTIFIVVGVTNAINLSDGLDGLAGGISLLSFICIGYLAFLTNNWEIYLITAVMIGAILGFLRFNTYPATVFMGDVGSQLLGFISITISIALTQKASGYSPILPLLIIGAPILDTFSVMFERIKDGKSPFQADNKHIHHKLLGLGIFHTESVLIIYLFQALIVTSAFIFRSSSDWLLLFLFLGLSFGFFLTIFTAYKFEWKRRSYNILDSAIKGRLRTLKEKQLIIKISFLVTKFGVPGLLIFNCFLAASIPKTVSVLSLLLLIFIVVFRIVLKKWNINLIRIPLYMVIPFVIYYAETNAVLWATEQMLRVYHIVFATIALFVILTLKFTRRKGFQSTPMDFLILFIALVVPNLPDENIRSYALGFVAAKMIGLFFSFEVLIGELRSDFVEIAKPTILVLLIIGIKGLVGL
jgi:UDP-GlcNAc:undecaprenyl-phosphate GlcNAc-1-phosphate transferase